MSGLSNPHARSGNPDPRYEPVRMGRWIISSVPANWFFDPAFGLRHNSLTLPASNITMHDDQLLAGNKLEPYINVQMKILTGRFDEPTFAGPRHSELFAADETMMLLIRHKPLNGVQVLQVQTYVRIGTWLGIITLSTLEGMLTSVRKDYESFIASLSVAPAEQSAPGAGATP